MENKLKQLVEALEIADEALKKHPVRWPEGDRGTTYSWRHLHQCINQVYSAQKAIIAYKLQASKIPGILKAAGLPIRKKYTTAIKGWHDYEYGFWSQTDTEAVWVYTQSQGYSSMGTYREVSELQVWVALGALEAAGYTVEKKGNNLK